MTAHRTVRIGMVVLLGLLLLAPLGCKKLTETDTSNRQTAGGGLGIDMQQNPPPAPPPPPPPPANQGPLPVGKQMDKLEHSGFPAPHTLVQSNGKLQQIGKGYIAAAITGPVNGPADLGPDFARVLKDPLNRDYVVKWGLDPSKVPSNTLLAWECTPDSTYHRRAVQADGAVVRISEAEFKQRTGTK